MNALLELQRRALDAFVDDHPVALSADIVAGGIPCSSRIGIYQNNVRETQRKCLGTAYPVVERLVGSECFRSLAVRYARQYPSSNADLQYFGDRFPAFLEAEYDGTKFAYLPDVARLERAIETALTAPRATPPDLEALAGIEPSARLRLRFPASAGATLIESSYPILAIWTANQDGGSGQASLCGGPDRLAVTRGDQTADIVRLDADAFELARCLAAGDTLGAAAARLAESPGFDLAASLNALYVNSWLGEFELACGDPRDR